MSRWTKSLIGFSRDESGATAIEYSMIAAAIGLLIVGAMEQIGALLKQIFLALLAGFA